MSNLWRRRIEIETQVLGGKRKPVVFQAVCRRRPAAFGSPSRVLPQDAGHVPAGAKSAHRSLWPLVTTVWSAAVSNEGEACGSRFSYRAEEAFFDKTA